MSQAVPTGVLRQGVLHTVNVANLVTSGYLLHLLWLNTDIEKVVLDQGMSKLIKTFHVTTGRSIVNKLTVWQRFPKLKLATHSLIMVLSAYQS